VVLALEVLACKISCVDLHPRIGAILTEVRDRNLDGIPYVTAALDAAIQETYAQSARKYPANKLRGVVLATNVRNLVLWHTEQEEFAQSGLQAHEGATARWV
jgi:hypothetical protein